MSMSPRCARMDCTQRPGYGADGGGPSERWKDNLRSPAGDVPRADNNEPTTRRHCDADDWDAVAETGNECEDADSAYVNAMEKIWAEAEAWVDAEAKVRCEKVFPRAGGADELWVAVRFSFETLLKQKMRMHAYLLPLHPLLKSSLPDVVVTQGAITYVCPTMWGSSQLECRFYRHQGPRTLASQHIVVATVARRPGDISGTFTTPTPIFITIPALVRRYVLASLRPDISLSSSCTTISFKPGRRRAIGGRGGVGSSPYRSPMPLRVGRGAIRRGGA